MDDLTNVQAIPAERLEAMSPVELAEALEQELSSMTEETYDPALIDAYLAALDRKAPLSPPPDPKAAFRNFQRKLQALPLEENSAPDNKKAPPPPARGKGRAFGRAMVSVAAATALLFTLMIGAQAAGMDIFGNLARWTDERLYLLSGKSTRNEETQDLFQQALEDCNMPTSLAPGWYPKGFTPELETWHDESSEAATVQLTFSSEDSGNFAISVDRYEDIETVKMLAEKDTEPVEIYTKNGRTFYLYSNVNIVSAISADGNLTESIWGNLSVDEIKKMINSMGGQAT